MSLFFDEMFAISWYNFVNSTDSADFSWVIKWLPINGIAQQSHRKNIVFSILILLFRPITTANATAY